VRAAVIALMSMLTVPAPAGAGGVRADAAEAAVDDAYRAAYSLDHDAAVARARQAVALAPGESRTHRTLATMLWLDILFRRGTVTVEHYLGGSARMRHSAPDPPEGLVAEYQQSVDRALAIARQRLGADDTDLDARYDLAAAYALQASFAASIDGSLTAAFGDARRAFDASEAVLERDSTRQDAALIVGTYRYLVSTFNLPTRMFAYLVGFGGGRERGIAMIEAASADPRVAVEARATLLLVYTRERRHVDVMRIASELAAEFPRNRLFTLEAGSAAVRAGRSRDAVAILARGLEHFLADTRPRIPGEHALWLYKLGQAHGGLGRLDDAVGDLSAALASGPVGWVEGRIRLELGKIADLRGARPEAVADYERASAICREAEDRPCERAADRLVTERFTGG